MWPSISAAVALTRPSCMRFYSCHFMGFRSFSASISCSVRNAVTVSRASMVQRIGKNPLTCSCRTPSRARVSTRDRPSSTSFRRHASAPGWSNDGGSAAVLRSGSCRSGCDRRRWSRSPAS
eukprot:13621583-Heterocapsa_arctica.AAC.1